MIGCFMAFAGTWFFAVLTIYMTALMSYFAGLAAVMGNIYGWHDSLFHGFLSDSIRLRLC